MSLLTSKDNRAEALGSKGPNADRVFQTSLRLRLQSFKEAVKSGEVPEGTIWLVRIIEAGQSLNGKLYTEEALRAAAPVFEGVTVQNYAWSQDPAADDADHIPDAVTAVDARGLNGNQVGSLEGVHFNETAKSLDGFLKVYDQTFREHLLTAFKLGDIGEGGMRDAFGFSIDADGIADEQGNVISITAAHELTAVNNPAAGGRVRRLVASTGLVGTKTGSPARASTEEYIVANKSKLMEKLGRRIALRENALEDKARMEMIMRAFTDELDSLRYGKMSDATTEEKVAFATDLTRDLAAALGGAGGMQESLKVAALKENAATVAGQLKLWADQLSTAADEEVPALLEQIRDEITKALDELSGQETTEEPESETDQEAEVAKTNETEEVASATQDDFARMSAGMTEKLSEALKSGDASKLREAAVEIVGEEPQLDEKDKTIAALKEKLEGQAISSAMSKLAESLADGAGPTVLRLIDRNTLTFNEDYSEVSGLKEAIKAIVKEFPGFGRVAESVVKEEETVAAAAAAPAKVVEAVPATPQQLAEAIVAADAPAPATAAPAAIGQDVVLRESVGAGSLEATPARLSQLRRYQKSMKAGNVKAMKKHRDLRTRLGL